MSLLLDQRYKSTSSTWQWMVIIFTCMEVAQYMVGLSRKKNISVYSYWFSFIMLKSFAALFLYAVEIVMKSACIHIFQLTQIILTNVYIIALLSPDPRADWDIYPMFQHIPELPLWWSVLGSLSHFLLLRTLATFQSMCLGSQSLSDLG